MDDLRRPTGILFSLLGAILLIYGLVNPEVQAPLHPSWNVNLWCGAVIFLFGGIMLWLSFPRKS